MRRSTSILIHTHTLQPPGPAQTRNDSGLRPATQHSLPPRRGAGCVHGCIGGQVCPPGRASSAAFVASCLAVGCPLRRCRAVDRVPGSYDSYASLGGLSGGGRPEGAGGLGGVPPFAAPGAGSWLWEPRRAIFQSSQRSATPHLRALAGSAKAPGSPRLKNLGLWGLEV